MDREQALSLKKGDRVRLIGHHDQTATVEAVSGGFRDAALWLRSDDGGLSTWRASQWEPMPALEYMAVYYSARDDETKTGRWCADKWSTDPHPSLLQLGRIVREKGSTATPTFEPINGDQNA